MVSIDVNRLGHREWGDGRGSVVVGKVIMKR